MVMAVRPMGLRPRADAIAGGRAYRWTIAAFEPVRWSLTAETSLSVQASQRFSGRGVWAERSTRWNGGGCCAHLPPSE